MDNQNKKSGLFSSFTPYSSKDPSLDVPVTAGPAGAIVSPYLNFDPTYIQGANESQFIFPEGANRHRGRFELAFSQIGGSVFLGGAVGGMNGLYSGYKETVGQYIGKERRFRMLNAITKGGASSAQGFGVIALMYSIFGTALGYFRGVEDELNTLTAGTLTGLLFKSSAGAQKCLRGGVIGFGLAATYCVITSRDKLKSMLE